MKELVSTPDINSFFFCPKIKLADNTQLSMSDNLTFIVILLETQGNPFQKLSSMGWKPMELT